MKKYVYKVKSGIKVKDERMDGQLAGLEELNNYIEKIESDIYNHFGEGAPLDFADKMHIDLDNDVLVLAEGTFVWDMDFEEFESEIFMVKKADLIFNEVYNSLIVYHENNNEHVVSLKELSDEDLQELKQLLKQDNIQFEENGNLMTCYLNQHSKKAAENVYTPEAIKKLEEEKRENHKALKKDFFEVI